VFNDETKEILLICEGKSNDDVRTGIIGEGQLVLAMIMAFLERIIDYT